MTLWLANLILCAAVIIQTGTILLQGRRITLLSERVVNLERLALTAAEAFLPEPDPDDDVVAEELLRYGMDPRQAYEENPPKGPVEFP